MKKINFIITAMFILFAGTASSAEWYEGGSLSNAGVLEWQEATPQNKIATSSDFVALMFQKKMLKSEIIKTIRSVNDIKPYAVELAACIEGATEKDPDEETNRQMFTNQTVSGMATLCIFTMGWDKEQTTQPAPIAEPTLGYIPNEFKTAYNETVRSTETGSEFLLHKNIELSEGHVNNTFQTFVSDHIGFIGTVQKNSNLIKELAMLAQGDGTVKSGINILLVQSTVIALFSPEMAKEERSNLALEMINKATEEKSENYSRVVGNIKYTINFSDAIGVLFIVSKL